MEVRPLNGAPAGIEILGLDLSTAHSSSLLEVGRLAAENLIVVIRDQKLSPQREDYICRQIGSVEEVIGPREAFCPLSENGEKVKSILQVSGMRDANGAPMGIFGHDSDLDWHANRASSEKERKPLVWLYSVFGSEGSRTSWANCSAAFHDLDKPTQEELSSLSGIFGFEPNRYTAVEGFFHSHRNLDGIKMVQTVKGTNRQGLYFPFLQLFGFKDKSEEYSQALINRLVEHVLQPQYVYHHDWRDGDVIISEQWMTIHKRWACDVSHRMLHRITFDYSNVQFNS